MTDQKTNEAVDAAAVAAGLAAKAAMALALAKLRLTAKLIPIIAPFLPVNDIRYYIMGVSVRPHKDGGAIIAATNGHVLAMMYDREAICDEEVILRIDKRAIMACAKTARKDRHLSILDGRLAVMEDHGEEVYIQAGNPVIDGKFPIYENIVGDSGYEPGLRGNFKGKYMAIADKVASAMQRAGIGDGYGATSFFTRGAGGVALMRTAVNSDFLAILMPMHDKPTDVAVESWVPRSTAPEAAVQP